LTIVRTDWESEQMMLSNLWRVLATAGIAVLAAYSAAAADEHPPILLKLNPPLGPVIALPLPVDGGPIGNPVDISPITGPVNRPPSQGDILPPTVRAELSPDVATLVAGNNQFAFNIFQRIAASADADKNLLVSPFSISSALAMTYAGARGRTAQQMAGVLGFNLPDEQLHGAYGELLSDLTAPRDAYQLNIANRLFVQSDYPFKQPFLDITTNSYQAPLESTNFIGDPEGSRQHINQWVADRTHDKILNLLPSGSVTSDTRLVLTNAIYFNGKWDSKFDEQNTVDRPFYAADGAAAPTQTMFQENRFRYGQFNGYQMLEIPYAGQDLSMVLMLPDARNGISSLESSISSEKVSSDLSAVSQTKVDVYLPKFKFDASFQLGDTFQSMGMSDAFSERADFSGISGQGPKLSDVIHKAFIDVNEAGTEAAAATAVISITAVGCYGCGIGQPPVFDADHPFLFALRDMHSGSLLFMGRVMQPGAASITSLGGPAVPEPMSRALLFVGVGCVIVGRLPWPSRRGRGPARWRKVSN
jgi:serpin B